MLGVWCYVPSANRTWQYPEAPCQLPPWNASANGNAATGLLKGHGLRKALLCGCGLVAPAALQLGFGAPGAVVDPSDDGIWLVVRRRQRQLAIKRPITADTIGARIALAQMTSDLKVVNLVAQHHHV